MVMLSSASTPFEIEVSDELSALGFSKIIVKGKDMFVTYNQGNIICTFYKNDWEKTAKSIRKKFQSENIDKNAISHFIVYLGREYIKLNSEDPKSPDTEKDKILEEIKKERAAAANVSQEEKQDQCDEQRAFDQVTHHGADGSADQAGAIVIGADFDTGRQARRELGDFLLHAFDHDA